MGGGDDTLDVGGLAVALRRGGAGAPVLFLHGALGQFSWPAALAALAERFEVVAPDLPGFGRTPRPDWLSKVEDIAYVMLDLIDRLDVGPVHVIGHSLGGWVALEMAIRSTTGIRSLVLAASGGIRVVGAPRADLFRHTPAGLADLAFADAATARTGAEWLRPENAMTHEANRYTLARVAWQPQWHEAQVEKWLRRVDVPTLVLWGDGDRVLPVAHGHALAGAIGGAALEILPGCGHMLHLEQPARFAASVARFIGGQGR